MAREGGGSHSTSEKLNGCCTKTSLCKSLRMYHGTKKQNGWVIFLLINDFFCRQVLAFLVYILDTIALVGWLIYFIWLKGVFAKNERGYRLNAIKKRFWSLLILLLTVASMRRKLLKTTNTEERSVLTNSERCNIQLGS